jgi:hypothetical protein
VDVSKNFITAASSKEGEFDTSTTTEAPFSTSASPSPVSVLTPVLGAAATASCPCSRSLLTSFDPMSPVPPITTIFMIFPSFFDRAVRSCRSFSLNRIPLHRVLSFSSPGVGRSKR